MKLWQKDYKLNEEIEKFTVGNDFLLDKNLVKYDVYGSIAHAIMLNRIGILSKEELNKIKKTLVKIFSLEKKFQIQIEDEDAHTAIENYLTKKLGDLGKKIHTARSRNEQVLVDLRLYSKEKLIEVQKCALDLASALIDAAEKFKSVPMPGYTHSRKAMPSSVGLFFSSFAESMMDNLEIIEEAYEVNDQSPLGSGAGYGLPLNVDRKLVAELLGFEKVQNNPIYVQSSRGKFESFIIFALGAVMGDLAKLSNDLIIFSMDEFGFFKLPDEFCTGSSIMPQKKNPDVLELVRAKAAKIDSNMHLVKSIASKLPSGYNRDLQLTKEPLMESFEITLSTLKIFSIIVKNLQVNEAKCLEACTKELFAAEHAYDLVKKGMPFRDAYAEVAKNLDKLQTKKHFSFPDLRLAESKLQISKIKSEVSKQESGLNSKLSSLLK